MDKLTVFDRSTSSGTTKETIKTIIKEDNELLEEILEELRLTRKGHEEWTWGEDVKDSDIDLEDIEEVEE